MYGSDEALALRLRDTKANLGFLDVSPYINTNDRPRLPDAEAEAFCRSTDRSSRPCFLAGDIRVNENHGKRLNDFKFQRQVFITGNHLIYFLLKRTNKNKTKLIRTVYELNQSSTEVL